ncbi:MAG: 4Fe-4S cluster-binding domain-containing protein [Lachnospiraceae bacterium]|jgi:uncharacterized protein|nr:4Fe-4S cluster-binding domain-containing protein [Lachnospiraceae bacterium]
MKYKASLYNYIDKCENGDLLIFNLLTQNKIKINSSLVPKIGYYFEKNKIYDIADDDKIAQKLINNKFIIPEDVDEIKIVLMKHNEVVYGTDTLKIQIMPTNDCNLRCVYCYETPKPKYMDDLTEKKVLKFIDRKLCYCKQLRFNWFGGEALLCKERVLRMSKEIHEMCKKNRVPMLGSMSTNAYLLDTNTFKALTSYRIREYQICVDGMQEQHNRTRPHYKEQDSFQKIFNNLLEIQKLPFNNFSIGIRCNITPDLEPYLEEYFEMLAKYFKGDERFYIILQAVRNWGGNRISDSMIPEEEGKLYLKWYKRVAESGLVSIEASSFAPFVGYCEANSKNGYAIDYNGSLHKCSIAMYNPNYTEVGVIGKIEDSGREVIDESKLAKWLVPSTIPSEQCQHCVIFPYCMGGHCFYKKNIKNEWSCNKYLLSLIQAHLQILYQKKKIRDIEE